MNPEDRKIYNQQYYQKNKEVILKKATEKVQCQFCFRTVSQNNLQKHFTLPICKRGQEQIQFIQQRNTPRL